MPSFVVNRLAIGSSLVFLSALWFLGGGGGSPNSTQPPPGGVATVTVTPATASISVGNTQQFTAVAKDSTGNVIVGAIFTWSSDATSIATVNSSGVATAVAQGTAHIKATTSGVNGTATLTVNPPISSVTVSPSTATINVGQTQQFNAVAKDSQGNVISLVTFTWSSDATSIATVDSNGLATGVSQGTAHISATASGVSGSGTLTVNSGVSGNAIPASFYGFTINDPCSISNTRPDGSSCSNTESHSFPGLPLTWSRSLGESYIKWSDIVQCDPTGSVCPEPGSGCSKDGLGSGGAPCPDGELVANCVPNAKSPDDPTNCAYFWVTFDFFANQFTAHSVDFMYDAYYTPDYLS